MEEAEFKPSTSVSGARCPNQLGRKHSSKMIWLLNPKKTNLGICNFKTFSGYNIFEIVAREKAVLVKVLQLRWNFETFWQKTFVSEVEWVLPLAVSSSSFKYSQKFFFKFKILYNLLHLKILLMPVGIRRNINLPRKPVL